MLLLNSIKQKSVNFPVCILFILCLLSRQRELDAQSEILRRCWIRA